MKLPTDLVENRTSTVGSITHAHRIVLLDTPAYKISKTALNSLTMQYSLSYEKEGFTIFGISPGVSSPLHISSYYLHLFSGSEPILVDLMQILTLKSVPRLVWNELLLQGKRRMGDFWISLLRGIHCIRVMIVHGRRDHFLWVFRYTISLKLPINLDFYPLSFFRQVNQSTIECLGLL